MKLNKYNFAPFAFSQISFTKKNIIVLSLLAVQMVLFAFAKELMLFYKIALSVTAIIFVNFIAGKINKNANWFDLSLVTDGVLIAFCTPNNYNLVAFFCLVAIAYFFVKIFFGGFGTNVFSTVAFTLMVLYFSFPNYFPQNLNMSEIVKPHGNMFSTLQINGFIRNDKAITSVLNYFFANIGVLIPEGYANMLLNNVSTIPAFRYNLLTLFSAAFLFAYDIGERLISFVFIIVYGFLVWVFSMRQIDGTFFSGDILLAFCTTGIFFYAFFIVGEASTTPNTKIGKIIYGLILGLVAFITCGPGACSIGIAFTIIIANICLPVILYFEEKIFYLTLRKKYGRSA
ncbi:MAG: RnfABCDGE type electron transport complex subunit D [Treponemataceae bacterium]